MNPSGKEGGAPVPAQPSGTVVLLRDRDDGPEVLLLRRNANLKFNGGAWVFPGGRVEDSDVAALARDDAVGAARRAAVRELHEEASLEVDESALVTMARWTTPEFMPKRFETWFFVARVGPGEVRVDGSEMDAHRWLRPADALAEQRACTLELPPPTFVTISQLAEFDSVEAATRAYSRSQPDIYTPKICKVDGGACSLYEGDAGYERGEAECDGPHHRLWILEAGWRYERG